MLCFVSGSVGYIKNDYCLELAIFKVVRICQTNVFDRD